MPREDRYKKAEVKRMMVDPYAAGDIYAAHPFLKEIVDAASEDKPMPSVPWNTYWRAVALAYDPDSPMVAEFPKPEMRKKYAFADAGVMLERDAELRPFALEYMIRCRNHTWTLLNCFEMVFADYALKVVSPQTGNDMDALKAQDLQGKMMDKMLDMKKNIQELRKEFYGGDKEMEKTDRILTPEAVGRRIKKMQ